MTLIRRLLLAVLSPVLRRAAERGRRRSTLRYDAFLRIASHARAGDVLVTTRSGSGASWLIPGRWSHAALLTDDASVVHAVWPRVQRAWLVELVLGATSVALLRPRFADKAQATQAVSYATTKIGLPYDLGFSAGIDAFYCSELVWRAYREACPEWRFEARRRLGEDTVAPQDLYDATRHFERIVEA